MREDANYEKLAMLTSTFTYLRVSCRTTPTNTAKEASQSVALDSDSTRAGPTRASSYAQPVSPTQGLPITIC